MTTNQPAYQPLAPGEINLDLIPSGFPLTPLFNKRAFLPDWPRKPHTVSEIKAVLDKGYANGVGLICGRTDNTSGIIMVDIDGEEAIPFIEDLAGGPLLEVLPRTLTITSGKPGRLRLVYSVSAHNSLPDKATFTIGDAPWEILWMTRQGVIMGAHPETDGYRTTEHGGFEYCKCLPELPDWIYKQIHNLYPSSRYRRPNLGRGDDVHLVQEINLQYEYGSEYEKQKIFEEALKYLNALDDARADRYEEWLGIGMALHQIGDELLGYWIAWSQSSDSFEDGCCEKKWATFERLPGGHSPVGARGLHTLRALAKEDGYVELGGYELSENIQDVIDEILAAGDSDGFEPNDEDHVATKFASLLEDIDVDKTKAAKKVTRSGPPASEMADLLSGYMKKQGWRYDPVFDTFLFYKNGIWEKQQHGKSFRYAVEQAFVGNNTAKVSLCEGYSLNYLEDVCALLEKHIAHTDWNTDSNNIAFSNGVLDVKTGDLLEHSHSNNMTWGLDFDYDPDMAPGPITEWLYKTQYNDEDRVQVLRAWLRACLVGKGNEIQRFLEVVGPGGRGKSTFANLCCALVGSGNYASTTLVQMEQSRFELSAIKGKRLTLINDSERYGGSAQTFKALTGGDSLRYEEKMKSIGEPFVYTGMVIVVANEPIQTTDNTSGLARRRLTIEFNRELYSKNSEAKDMIKLSNGKVSGYWRPYLPGLVNWVLQMTDEEMRKYLLDTHEVVPALQKVRNNILVNSNNLIEWLQSECVYDAEHISAVGKKVPAPRPEPGVPSERYCNSGTQLYPSYCSHAEDTGSKPVGQKRFINLLLDCCKNQLGLGEVTHFTRQGRTFVKGIAIRSSDNKFKNYPTILAE